MKKVVLIVLLAWAGGAWAADDWWKPYSPPCTERENVFEFTEKPAVKSLGNDKYEITFAVKGNCDVTVGIVGDGGKVIRHLGSGVLGANAPLPFQKNSLKQTICWNGKDDLDEYHKTPEKLKVRVMLGLKPAFDKLLGPTNPKNLPGYVLGIAVAPDGAYVMCCGKRQGMAFLRKFDHDGKYVSSVVPPPANMPEEKLKGMGFIEYEPGKRALHAPTVHQTVGDHGEYLLNGQLWGGIQPVVVGGRFYHCNSGARYPQRGTPELFYLYTDGSTDVEGLRGRPLFPFTTNFDFPRFAASPDGTWLYVIGMSAGWGRGQSIAEVVVRLPLKGEGKAEVIVGKRIPGGALDTEPGSDNEHLNNPSGLDCDGHGRIYVADQYNHRVQIFSPDGKYLKTIPVGGARLVRVHQKDGGIYVQHIGNDHGRSVPRLTKFVSFDDPKEAWHVDGMSSDKIAVDSWTAKPRLWLGEPHITVLEDDGTGLRKVADFAEDTRAGAPEFAMDGWFGDIFEHLTCDPMREQVLFRCFRNDPWIFDLKTGQLLNRIHMRRAMDDLAFDKRGYLHGHFDTPMDSAPGVVRLDPEQTTSYRDAVGRENPRLRVPKEVPYDYGIEIEHPGRVLWLGALPVKDQPGPKFFQDGLGVNMRGEIAVESNIYYIPKMGEESWKTMYDGHPDVGDNTYAGYQRSIQDAQKRGEEIYSLKWRPGRPLCGATIWTFDRTGEVRHECAVTAPFSVSGVQVDEEGCLYFIQTSVKLVGGKPFLQGRGGTIGLDKPLPPRGPATPANDNPTTATYIKTAGDGTDFLMDAAPVPLEPTPDRPKDLSSSGKGIWLENAKWVYAGASPVAAVGCSCPAVRAHLDWYKRSYVPESYRHSVGILDTNGNLIMHLGRYGNFDDALRMKTGTDDVVLTLPRFISGTDNYLAFDDWGERLVVLKLNYHADETVGIGEVMSAK